MKSSNYIPKTSGCYTAPHGDLHDNTRNNIKIDFTIKRDRRSESTKFKVGIETKIINEKNEVLAGYDSVAHYILENFNSNPDKNLFRKLILKAFNIHVKSFKKVTSDYDKSYSFKVEKPAQKQFTRELTAQFKGEYPETIKNYIPFRSIVDLK